MCGQYKGLWRHSIQSAGTFAITRPNGAWQRQVATLWVAQVALSQGCNLPFVLSMHPHVPKFMLGPVKITKHHFQIQLLV